MGTLCTTTSGVVRPAMEIDSVAPPALGASTWKLLSWAAAGLLTLIGLYWLTAPGGVEGTWCLLRRAGVPCPGCGTTRAVGALLRGELVTAFRWHPLAIPLFVEGILLYLYAGWRWAKSGILPAPSGPQAEAWLVLHATVFVALWLGRTATGTLPW